MSSELLYRSLVLAMTLFLGACGAALAHPMWGIAVDRAGQVYFSDLTTVWRIDSGGRVSVFRPKGEGHVHEISLDAEGNLLGAENTYVPETKKFFSAIWKMTPAGQSSYLVPLQEMPPKGTSIWCDGGGNAYYVTEFPSGKLLVLKRTPPGEVSVLVGEERAARDYRQSVPYGIGPVAFSSDGEIFFTHGANVSKVDREGRFTTLAKDLTREVTSAKREKTSLYGIAVDSNGNPVVADYGNRRVFRIGAADNRITTVARTEGPWHPTGLAVRGGDVYMVEIGHTPSHEPVGTRVRRLSPDGAVTVLATVDAKSTANAASTPSSQPDGPTPANAKTKEAKEPARSTNYLPIAMLAIFGVVVSVVTLRMARARA